MENYRWHMSELHQTLPTPPSFLHFFLLQKKKRKKEKAKKRSWFQRASQGICIMFQG